MCFFRYADRLQRMHRLIKFKRTGTPEQCAKKLGIGTSSLYSLIKDIKDMGGPVYYCHLRESYAYSRSVDLHIGFTHVSREDYDIEEVELRSTAGGGATIRELTPDGPDMGTAC